MEQTNVNLKDFRNFETYAVILNGDSSLLLLNPYLEPKGYIFVAIPLSDFQHRFSDLIGLPKIYRPEVNLKLMDGTYISREFFELIKSNSNFGHKVMGNLEVILLKRIEVCSVEREDKIYHPGESISITSEVKKFSKNLLEQLRLFKSGDIAIPLVFQIDVDSRVVGVSQHFLRKTYGDKDYLITSEEADKLNKELSADFVPNELTRLAVDTFNECYEIGMPKVRFIMLMVCLESLMNQGKDQIVHTISRHTALVLAEDPDDFQNYYKRIKQLYDYRSKIVHGAAIKEDIGKVTAELENYVRIVIKYFLKMEGTKEELFARFNQSGF